MMRHQLKLDYTLSPGWMLTWVDGLLRGETIARACNACGKKSFAPQRVCKCGCNEGTWVKLSGEASVLRQTIGADGHFALVQFDGADIETIVRLDGFEPSQMRGRLKSSSGHLPQMILEPLAEAEE